VGGFIRTELEQSTGIKHTDDWSERLLRTATSLAPFPPQSPSFASSCRFLQTSAMMNRWYPRIKSKHWYPRTWVRSGTFRNTDVKRASA